MNIDHLESPFTLRRPPHSGLLKDELDTLVENLNRTQDTLRDQLHTRLAVEDSLTVSRLNYSRIVNTLNEGLFIIDARSGLVREVNETACHLFGWTRSSFHRQRSLI